MSEDRAYTVFEVVNNAAKEIYVAATREPIFEAINKLRNATPAAIRHWKPMRHSNPMSIQSYLDEAGRFQKEESIFFESEAKSTIAESR